MDALLCYYYCLSVWIMGFMICVRWLHWPKGTASVL